MQSAVNKDLQNVSGTSPFLLLTKMYQLIAYFHTSFNTTLNLLRDEFDRNDSGLPETMLSQCKITRESF